MAVLQHSKVSTLCSLMCPERRVLVHLEDLLKRLKWVNSYAFQNERLSRESSLIGTFGIRGLKKVHAAFSQKSWLCNLLLNI